MPVGSPRVYDRSEIARQLLEWSLKETSLNLCGFCGEKEIDPNVILRWTKDLNDDEFGRAYRLVKARLGERREQRLGEGKLHTKAYDLNAKTYDYFLKVEHYEQLDYEAKLKAAEAITVTDQQLEGYAKVTNAISKYHSAELKTEATKETQNHNG